LIAVKKLLAVRVLPFLVLDFAECGAIADPN
jgi:hypothetical protein